MFRIALLFLFFASTVRAADRPNILLLSCEDISPLLGCYGDSYAVTPNIDAFAKRSLKYNFCWSNAPVCAPARTTIITGMYPPSLGAEHMRSFVKLPKGVELFPSYLRQAGYYCTNNVKEDYNVEKPAGTWDASSNQAHYRNRKKDQPFFAVFNNTGTHESQIRKPKAVPKHDPAKAPLPPFYPDLPEIRRDIALYYDNVTTMDEWFGKQLKDLEDAGLKEDTIVFFFGDHGTGMPGYKRQAQNRGLRVPLLIHIPEKWKALASKEYKAGGDTDRLVSFVDFAPTLLSLADIKAPGHMQGKAFLGKHEAEPNKYLFGFRGRMDERADMVRCVTDGRYVYVRNYYPWEPKGQRNAYMFLTPTTVAWHKAAQAKDAKPEVAAFWKPREFEEFYDLRNDPHESRPVEIADSTIQDKKNTLAKDLMDWQTRIRDLGYLPEDAMHSFATASSPRDAFAEDKTYPIGVYQFAASVAANKQLKVDDALWMTPQFFSLNTISNSKHPAYTWVARGFLARDVKVFEEKGVLLKDTMTSGAPSVKVTAAEVVATFGKKEQLEECLDVLVEHADMTKHGMYTAMAALEALDHLGDKAKGRKDAIAKLPRPKENANGDQRGAMGVAKLIETIIAK